MRMGATAADKRAKDLAVVTRFIEVYCLKNHATPKGSLCPECQDLLDYARQRLEKCPLDPKPKCKNCEVHCYKPEYRGRIQKVMRFSGIYFVKRGRVDWLVRYFMGS